jgi:hypothetical protein
MIVLALLLLVSGLTLFATEIDLVPGVEGAALKLSSVALPVGAALRRRRGRPRKFSAPSKAVTLTLPENVLQMLATIDPDPSLAIVQLTKRRAPAQGRPAAELSVFGQRAIITIRPTRTLERQIGLDLVPLPDGRALISFDQPTTVAELELMLYDGLQDSSLSADDRNVFEGIARILTDARRSDDVTLLNRSIIVLESSRTRRRRSPKAAER